MESPLADAVVIDAIDNVADCASHRSIQNNVRQRVLSARECRTRR
jgi:hypothetical protein